jgi:DNA-binding transcriptional LysR family regulator
VGSEKVRLRSLICSKGSLSLLRYAPRFDSYAMALQAAVDGVGVAIGLRPYVVDDLASGRLVAPFKLAVPKGQAWYLVYRPFRQDDAALVAFRDWLTANVERDPG